MTSNGFVYGPRKRRGKPKKPTPPPKQKRKQWTILVQTRLAILRCTDCPVGGDDGSEARGVLPSGVSVTMVRTDRGESERSAGLPPAPNESLYR